MNRSNNIPTPLAKPDPRTSLFVTDLDGTLLMPDSKLPPGGAERLNRLIDRGLKFTVATARNHDSAYPILRDLKLPIPVILFNGVYLTDFTTGQNVTLSSFLERELVDDLTGMSLDRGIDPFIYSYGNRHQVYYRAAVNPGARNYLSSLDGDDRLQYVRNYAIGAQEQVSGVLLIETHGALSPIYDLLREKYTDDLNIYFAEDVATPGYFWMQIFHRNAGKGKMLEILARQLDIPLAQVVAFGDYLNDLDMFRVAGRAVAMGNALPEVKSAAHEVIGANTTGAVINYLESLDWNSSS